MVKNCRMPLKGSLKGCRALLLAVTFSASVTVWAAEPEQLTQRINALVAQQLTSAQLVPAPAVDDATFLRRVSLDLIGRTPTVEEVQEFSSEPTPDKRAHRVDQLLASPEHADHFARTWRALLIPESDTDRQIRYFVPGFESWLREQRQQRVGFDRLVRDLLTVPITGTKEQPQLVLTDMKGANPLAFYACKNASAADLASTTMRLFLGVRLECAQCHDHPFDSWTQQQFWNQAAFFAGIERKGRGSFAPILENRTQTNITMTESEEVVPAIFLDGAQPTFEAHQAPREQLANWIVSAENDLFAQAISNRVWGELLGVGLVDPVDDFHAGNPPSHPELLQLLGNAFRDSQFDLDVLYRSICLSDAYQRSSTRTSEEPQAARLYAYRAIKPMTGEQFYDSLDLALGLNSSRGNIERTSNGNRRRVVDLFATHGNPRDPETSVAQALVLMNSNLIHGSLTSTVQKQVAQRDANDQELISEFYLRAFSRPPSASELKLCLSHLQEGSEQSREQQLTDILWALLNSAEFRWNH